MPNLTPMLSTNSKVYFSLLEAGDTAEPVSTTITVDTGGAAKAATSIPVTALASNVKIPRYSYLLFSSAAGATVLAQVNALAEATDTSITVLALGEAVTAGMTATWPPQLEIRTGFSIGRSSQEETYTTLEDPFEKRIGVSISGDVTVSGFYSAKDPAYNMAEYCQREQEFGWLKIEFPPSSAAYTTGKVYKGVASVTDTSLDASSGGLIAADLSFGFAQNPTIVNEVPT